jgi:hypothetical protein
MKFKMAASLSLTLDPMGKMFQNASSLKPLGQLKPNCPGMIIGRSSIKYMFFMLIGNPRWLIKFLFFMPIGNPRWLPPRHLPFYIRTKNLNFVEDHSMNIPV